MKCDSARKTRSRHAAKLTQVQLSSSLSSTGLRLVENRGIVCRSRKTEDKTVHLAQKKKEKKMSSVQGSSGKKFWKTPELVDLLLGHLDATSILELAKAHPPTILNLQSVCLWNKLIQKTCPNDTRRPFGDTPDTPWLEKNLSAKKAKIEPLIKLLAKMEEPQDYVVSLLDLICTRFPADASRQFTVSKDASGKLLYQTEGFVEVSCPRHAASHSVSPLGFLVLEEVERSLGSAEQRVEKVGLGHLGGLLISSLGSRMLRQEEQEGVTAIKLDLAEISCNNQQEAENLLLPLKNCQKLTALLLAVADGVNAEAWAAVSKAVKLHHGECGLSATRSALLNGRREDLKTIWEAVKSVEVMYSEAFISEGEVFIEKEEGWARLEQVLDMTEDQWRAEAQKDMDGEEEEEEEEDEGEEEGEEDDDFIIDEEEEREEEEGNEEEVEEEEGEEDYVHLLQLILQGQMEEEEDHLEEQEG